MSDFSPAGPDIRQAQEQWLGYTELVLELVDTDHVWRLAKGGLESLPEQPRSGELPKLLQVNDRQEAAGGCR